MTQAGWTNDGQTTIPAVLREAVARHPDREAFDFTGETISYAGVDRESLRLAHGLIDLGVGKGDTVCTMLDNSLDAVLLLYAITRIGAVSVPVNTSFRGEFLRHQLADTGAAVLIAETDYADRILGLTDQLPNARILLHRGAAPSVSSAIDIRSLESIRADRTDPINVAVEPSDLSMLIYTSGTTGPSKGCMIPHNYICNMARQIIDGFGLRNDDVFWTPLPLFHANAICCAAIGTVMAGVRCAVVPRFSLSGFWPEIERTGATVITMIGSIVALVAGAPDTAESRRCFGQIRVAVGAPFPESMKAIWRARFGVQHAGTPGYGMTEICMITFTPLDQPSPPGTSGRRFVDYDVKIIDDSGAECPPDVPGEIIARPNRPNLMFKGYWRRPEASMQVMDNLWFHTGDVGKIDANGYFSFVDRKKDYLRRGGENISSFEMETTFRAHPAIEDVAVHAVASELTEDEVKVTAVLKPEATLDEADLCRWAIERVPHFAVPRYIEFRTDLPRNPVGRVLKYELRAEGVTPATWDRSRSDIVVAKR